MPEKRITKVASRALVALGEGIFSRAVDMTLWLVAYTAVSFDPFVPTYGKTWKTGVDADRFLNTINYDVIKEAIKSGRRRGWIKKAKRRRVAPEITEEGKNRLASLLPVYQEKRTWDGKMRLVTYDIPEKQRKSRDILRDYLRRLGCGRLQDSVWITPYNPTEVLREYITQNRLQGTIIVSDMGKDGSIGEEDFASLVRRVYGLEKLNERYEAWLEEVENVGKVDYWLALQYLSILQDDPQLPFDLLANWWQGDKAYKKVAPLLLPKASFK